jgi:pilus assembly protein CpaE
MASEPQTPPTAPANSRRKLRILLIASGPDRAEIRSALSLLTEPRLEIREADAGTASPIAGDPVDVVMFGFDKDHPRGVPAAVTGSARPVRIALVRDRTSLAIREALRSGADEVLFLPLDQGELTRALLKISETHPNQEPGVKGRLIALVSVTGGAGVTSIAANCALALAHAAEKKVALVDLDFQSGDLAVVLNVEPERTILDLNNPGERLNSVQIESALTRHSSGVYLLAAPRRIEESEQIPAAQVGAVLDLLREMVDCVIVDIGRHVDDTSVVVWERCDELIYVIDQSVSAMRGAWRFLDLFGRLNIAGVQPRFVLNRWEARRPISEKHVVNTLGRALMGHIPRDDASLEHALGLGEDLWKVAPRALLTRSYEALAHDLSGPHHGGEKRGGFLSRIFARNGVHPRS